MTDSEKLKNALEALRELADMNHLRNDFDAYCYELAQWGMGKSANNQGDFVDSDCPVKPNPKDFGL